MPARTRVARAVAMTFAAVVASTSIATGALADVEPVPQPTSGQVSDQSPVAGGTVTISGAGFYSSESVSFDALADVESVQAAAAAARTEGIGSVRAAGAAARTETIATAHLTSATSNAAGVVSAQVQIPSDVSGMVAIVMTGQVSGRQVSVLLSVTAADDSLAVTGTDVLAFVASGLVFVVGGAGLVVAGRRRRAVRPV